MSKRKTKMKSCQPVGAKANIETKKNDGNGRITKKKKRLSKKADFISKLTASNDARDMLKKANKRAQTVIVGDLNPLLEAITEIKSEKPTKKRIITVKPLKDRKKKIASEKIRMKSNLTDIDLFGRVTSNAKFKASPIHAIQDHVNYLMDN